MADVDPIAPTDRIDLASEREFELGGLKVRPSERIVLKNGEERELQPRVMQVLVALARSRPKVISRDMLIEQCWDGRIVGDDALNRCVLALRHLAQEFTPHPFDIQTVPRVGHRLVEAGSAASTTGPATISKHRHALAIAALLILFVGAIGALAIFRPWEAGGRVHAVLITTVASDSVSRDLADDLAVKLGNLQYPQSASLRLIGRGSTERPDLLLEVKRLTDPAKVGASILLKEASSHSVIWSSELEQPSRKPADLKQQVAYTVAHVLRCASEGLASEDPLSHETLRTYLGACAAMSDAPAYDGRPVVRALERVVSSSPGFVGGWAKLLQAESDALVSPVVPAGPTAAPSLRRHIQAARRLKRHMPEAYLAEYDLTRPVDFVGRARLIDEAVERSPNHAGVRTMRALFFASVGRQDDAVREAREAVRLDPLSPALRDIFAAALAAAGDTKGALEEVAKVERLWPGASSAIEARYRTHLRYGDPREALRLIQSRAVDMPVAPFHRTFLEARIEPSPANVEKAIRQDRRLYRDHPQSIYNYAQTLAEFDRKEELLQLLLNPSDLNELALSTESFFRPAFSEVHRDPRFMRVANSIGLLEYWRNTGDWPDFCYRPDLPYDCKAEAAKLAA